MEIKNFVALYNPYTENRGYTKDDWTSANATLGFELCGSYESFIGFIREAEDRPSLFNGGFEEDMVDYNYRIRSDIEDEIKREIAAHR